MNGSAAFRMLEGWWTHVSNRAWVRRLIGLSFAAAIVSLVAAFSLGEGPWVHAQSASGTVTVTATDNAKLTIAISDQNASFGDSVAPDGTGVGGEVSSVVSISGAEAAYYIWTPSTTPLVTVKSNRMWNGTVSATENTGTSNTMTIASGVLRWSTAVPDSYAEAAGATAFSTSPAVWQTNHGPGRASFTYYFLLRVDWTDTPGTFSSTVTYSATQ